MKQNYKLNRNMKLIQLLIVYFIVLKCLVTADVIVINGNQTIEEFRDLPAQFGKQLPSNGLTFSAVEAYPSNGCEKISPPPKKEKDSRWVVLIARGNCTFVEKVRRAQDAGFDAVIIFNVGSDALERMGADNAVDIKIPSVFIGETSAKFIQEGYLYPNEYLLLIIEESQFNINTHLILPFSILVGLCFIIMIAYMLIKCAREQRRLRRHRLPKRLLRKLGTTKFCKTDPYDTCVICLDEYSEGEKIRVLPCGHAYHCQCIDPWLTKNRRVCPICKRKVFPGRQSRPNSVRRNSIDSTTDSETDDTAPLLNPVENSNNHGTFSNNEQSLNQISVNNTAADTENIRPSSDEENALDIANRNVDGNQQSSQRINPFNRVPPNLVNDENNRRSFWSRLFRRQTSPDTITTISRTIEPSQQHEQQDLSVSIPVNLPSSSNNILNSNLSGSLKDSDEELLERNSIYESTQSSPTINIIPSSAILTNPYDNSHNNDNLVFVQTPPSQGGLGVVALPNTNFTSNRASSSTNPTERRTRPNSNRHFIV